MKRVTPEAVLVWCILVERFLRLCPNSRDVRLSRVFPICEDGQAIEAVRTPAVTFALSFYRLGCPAVG